MQAREQLGVTYLREDSGNCRLYYRPKDKQDKRLFCTQPNHNNIQQWYICSKEGEPSHIITKIELVVVF